MAGSTGVLQSALADFTAATGDLHIGVGDLFPINIAGLNHHRFMRHFDFAKKVAGGDRIDLNFMVGGNGSFKTGVQAGEYRQPKKKDTTVRGYLDYVLSIGNGAWFDVELEHNAEKMTMLEIGDAEARAEIIMSMYKLAMAKAEVDLVQGVETQYGDVPDYSLMGSTSTFRAQKMMSLFAHINWDFKGVYGLVTSSGITAAGALGGSAGTDYNTTVATTGTIATGVWLTKQGLNANDAMFTRAIDSVCMYAPTKVTYSSATLTAQSTNIVSAIKEAKRKSAYETIPMVFRDGGWRTVDYDEDLYLLGSNKAVVEIEGAVLAGQDLWTTSDRQDPTVRPHFGPSKLNWWNRMDVALIYDGSTHTIKVAEGTSTADDRGPRVIGYRAASLYPLIHKANNFRVREPGVGQHIPDQHIVWIDLEGNLACEDYRPQFIVGPTGQVYGAY